jgi:hypothetical protein
MVATLYRLSLPEERLDRVLIEGVVEWIHARAVARSAHAAAFAEKALRNF